MRRILAFSARGGRRTAPCLAASLIAVLYLSSRLPKLGESDAARIAARFRFTRHTCRNCRTYRASIPGHSRVHPSLQRIAAWVSFVGAAAALGDLDGDGHPMIWCRSTRASTK